MASKLPDVLPSSSQKRSPSFQSIAQKKEEDSEEVGIFADNVGGLDAARAREKQLVGSLSNSYAAKVGGLVKKVRGSIAP